MSRIPEQRRRLGASRRRVAASPGRWVLLLLGASACNSLLGIHEASLDCDDPGCASGDPSSGASSGMDGPAADGVDRADGGMDPNGVAGRSGGAGAAGASTSSGASSEAGPAAPIAPPEGAGGGPTNGSSATSSGGSAGGAEAPPPSGGGATSGAAAGGAPGGALCNSGDACGDCLCESCGEPLAACTDTPGCLEILACARNSGCVGFACYCGSVDLLTCATSNLADGPCVATMLAAQGSHPPTVSEPNAGPASRAALVVADCRGQRCAAACGD